MGSAAEITEPTTGTEKHRPVEVEEEDEQIVDLERKASSFRHGKGLYSTDGSTITTNTSSSSSFSGDGPEGIPYFRNGEEEHIVPENLEVPESPEQETESGFHDENNCNVYFDGEHGSESAGAESDGHEPQNGEEKQPESEKGSSTFKDNKGTREIEEVTEGNSIEEQDVDDQPTGDVIEEEIEIDDAEDYDVEKVLDNQETHDLFCPNCNSCITKRVVLKRRKRKIRHVLEDPKRFRGPHWTDPPLHSEDNLPSADAGENSVRESFVFKCLSCFSIFIPKGVGSKPNSPSEGVEVLNTQPNPQEEATGDSNWFSSIFGFNKKGSAVQPGVPEANPRDNVSLSGEDTTGSTVNTPSKAPALVQGDAVRDGSEMSASQDIKPVDSSLIQANTNSDDTIKVVNNGAIVEDGQKVLVAPSVEEQTLQKMDKDDSSPAEGNHTSLSPIQPSRDMNIVNKVTTGPEGVRIETTFHAEDGSHLFEGINTSDTSKPDVGLTKVTTGVVDNGDRVVISSPPISGIDIPPVSSLEEGTLREPLIRPVVEGRKLEVLKSIVYGGLIESITSLGVISSASASGASTLNILVLGVANILGGLILIIHNLQELRDEEPRRITTDGQEEEEGRYKRLLGRRENFTLHATVAILSFIIVGLIPPVVYAFSFNKTHNRDYKVASVFGSSLLCIVLLAIAKARVKTPRGSYYKSILYYAMIAVSVSGISYVVGNFLEHLLEKYGWSEGSDSPAGQMMLSLLGRKAGSFGYSSSYGN